MRDLRKLGYVPDAPHKKALFKKLGAAPPHSASASSESLEGTILDQNSTGSCTGHGSSQWLQVSYAKAGRPLPFRPSPRSIYALTRGLDRAAATPAGQPLPALQDVGGMPADVVLALSQYGIEPLVMPSPQGFQSDVDPSNVNAELTLGDLEKAAGELLQAARIVDPSQPDWQDALASALEANGAAGVGVFVDTAFEQWTPAQGPVQSINQSDQNGGGHWLAVTSFRTCVAGSADAASGVPVGALIFRGPNSWTNTWGDKGHWEMTGACLQAVCSACYSLYL